MPDVFEFLQGMHAAAMWSSECHIIALVYVSRLLEVGVSVHARNWRPVLLCALLLAQKVKYQIPNTKYQIYL